MGISLQRGPAGEPGRGSSTRDFERGMKGAPLLGTLEDM